MSFYEPYPIERGFITEQMTDEEIRSFCDAIELYLNAEPEEADKIIAFELPEKLWRLILVYRENLSEYYAEEGDHDAEQDN